MQFARENPGAILGAMATILRSRAGDDIKSVGRFPGWARKIALPLMGVAGAPQLLDHFRAAKEEYAKSLRYYDELEELTGKMHQHALAHGFYDAETRTAWFAVRELRDKFSPCIRALFPDGRLPAVQGIVSKMRKFEGNKIGSYRAPHRIEMLSDNGAPYTARDTRIFAQQLGLKPCFTPVKSPQSNGISEAFVNTLKRDYVRVTPLPNAETVLGLIPGWFEDYNENHPHSGLKMRSPREFRSAQTATA